MLHATLHAGDVTDRARRETKCFDRPLWTVEVNSDQLQRPLPVRFDDLYPQLESLPRFFIEPDGSFLWTSTDGPRRWQIDGQLHDSVGNLMTVELKLSGEPPREGLSEALDQLLLLVDPHERFVFELVRPGVYIDYAQLKQLLPLEL